MDKQDIYLVLGGGAALGYAHIGVIAELEKKYNIRGIIGTSMGSIIGGLYASRLNPVEILEIAKEINLANFLKKNIFGFRKGLLDTEELLKSFNQFTNNVLIENLEIEYAAIAFDLYGIAPKYIPETVIIKQGCLSSAMVASSNLPFLNNPFKYQGRYLIDGGVGFPLPIEFVGCFKEELPIIAVNVLPSLLYDPSQLEVEEVRNEKKISNDFFFINALKANIYNQAYLALNSIQNVKPDIYISAHISSLNAWDFDKVDEFYALGIKSVNESLQRINDEDDIIDEITNKSKNLFKRIKKVFNYLKNNA